MTADDQPVLLVDDNAEVLETFSEILADEGFQVLTAGNADDALRITLQRDVRVVISDLCMPGEMSGLDLLEQLREKAPQTDFIMLTGKGTIESAVKALKTGAFDYLTKPLDPEELITTLKRVLAYRDLEEENRRLRQDLMRQQGQSPLVVGPSERMRAVLGTLQAVAPLNTGVLICGESGTGKEVIADEIHRLSPRAGNRLVKVNCAALPESLLESELFGHEKGAFTGATNKRVGFFEEADGGTVFLDEIAEMSPLLQAKLLRVLQERTIHRVGSTQELSIDVRVICATNKDLEAAVAKGDFREDLYYRINVVRITLPPLRDRREDIPLLAEELLRRSARRVGVPPKAFTPEALAFLQAMELPGNVRELQNRVERSLIFSRGTVITVDDLQAETVPVTDMQAAAAYRPEPAEPAPSQAAAVQAAPPAAPGAEPALPSGASLEEIEQETIRRVLQTNRGNMQQSAKQLKISRSTLYSKVKKYNLEGVGRSP